MALSVETLAEEALRLPASERALLVEQLPAGLVGETNPAFNYTIEDNAM